MTGAEPFAGGFSSSFGTASVVDSFIGLVYKHGKDITVNPEQGVTVRHGPYPVGPSLHPTSTWRNFESGSLTFVVISKDRHNSKKRVKNVPQGQRQLKANGKMQSQGEADAAAYHDKHERMAKDWTAIPLRVSWDVMIVRWEYVDKVLAEKQGVLESSYSQIARLQERAASFGAGSEGLAKLEVEIGRIRSQMFAVREEMFGILAFRLMFEGIVVMFNCRVTELSSWGKWKLNSPQNCAVKMGFKIRTNEKNGHTGMSIAVRFEEKVFSWTRLKTGKLEIHDGMFKSFTGEIGEDCKSLRKVSNPTKTWVESKPAPPTKALEYTYKKSLSWEYLDRVKDGDDPTIAEDAGGWGKLNREKERAEKERAERERAEEKRAEEKRDADLIAGFRQRAAASKPRATSPGGPKGQGAAQRPTVRPRAANPSRVSDRPGAATSAQSANKAKRKPPKPSGTQSNPPSAPKPGSGARVRTRGADT